jgi:hypothetical protein
MFSKYGRRTRSAPTTMRHNFVQKSTESTLFCSVPPYKLVVHHSKSVANWSVSDRLFNPLFFDNHLYETSLHHCDGPPYERNNFFPLTNSPTSRQETSNHGVASFGIDGFGSNRVS